MSTAEIRADLLNIFKNTKDERFLKMIYALTREYNQEKNVELSQAHKKILDERLVSHQQNPDAGSSWDEVRSRIEKQL